jgi:hypothetical protein
MTLDVFLKGNRTDLIERTGVKVDAIASAGNVLLRALVGMRALVDKAADK